MSCGSLSVPCRDPVQPSVRAGGQDPTSPRHPCSIHGGVGRLAEEEALAQEEERGASVDCAPRRPDWGIRRDGTL